MYERGSSEVRSQFESRTGVGLLMSQPKYAVMATIVSFICFLSQRGRQQNNDFLSPSRRLLPLGTVEMKEECASHYRHLGKDVPWDKK